jgi:TolB-like protein/DNA-binding winged helix-turn-helix (wHTH) protein
MPPHPPRLRFGQFEFDAASGELSCEGRRVRLQRQPSRLLELLLERPGDVIAREEIRQALWGEDTHVDFERSLNFCVAKLRAALRDNAAEPRFIETLPTRGYRFIAPVTVSGSGAMNGAAPPSEAPGARPSARRSSRRASIVAAVSVVVLAVATAFWWHPGPPPAVGSPKVVVVPFHNETGSPEMDRVAKGVSDATVARLATPDRLSRLRVIGNAAGLTLSFRPRDMKAMGESLDAQYLVLGQMKKDDRGMRIVAHLIRVSDQTHLWAKTYDTQTLDLPQQESIAEQIAVAVADNVGKG